MPNDLAYEMLKHMQQVQIPIKSTGPFRGIGDLFNYIGLLVCGGMIILWSLRKIVKEIWEYVSVRLSTGRKDLQ